MSSDNCIDEILQHPNISWSSKALFLYLDRYKKGLTADFEKAKKVYKGNMRGNSSGAMQTMMKELREAGYVIYEKTHDSSGQWAHEYFISI